MKHRILIEFEASKPLPADFTDMVLNRVYMLDCVDKVECTATLVVDSTLMPNNPTHSIISAMSCSQARDDEGSFPQMMDLLDFGGENKTHTVLKAAYIAAINAAKDTQ